MPPFASAIGIELREKTPNLFAARGHLTFRRMNNFKKGNYAISRKCDVTGEILFSIFKGEIFSREGERKVVGFSVP